MKFLRKNTSVAAHDYIDALVIHALPAHHHKFIQKLLSSESSHINKFFNKLSSNEVYLNHDMLFKILDALLLQMTLPLQALEHPDTNTYLEFFKHEHLDCEHSQASHWLSFLEKLKIWQHSESAQIAPYLNLAYQYIDQDQFPVFNQERTPSHYERFFKKTNINHLSTEVLFKYIFEKLKYFHNDTLPHSKRPMDLFELFCPLEDAALELRLVVLNEKQSSFLRSLNASALIFSAMQAFPYTLPDLVADDLERHHEFNLKNFWGTFLNHQELQPLFGQHPHLNDLNLHALYIGINHYLNETLKTKGSIHNPLEYIYDFLHQPSANKQAQLYFQNLTNRLIFIFNRLTSLGYLLRSPLLKGHGYHPLINSEVPNRIAENFPIFLQHFLNKSESEKLIFLKQFKFKDNRSDLTKNILQH